MPLAVTTLDVVVATIARRIRARHRSLWAPVCSIEKSTLLRFPLVFGSLPRSPSTRERRIPGSGSTTTAWRASWAVRLTIPSSFATFLCILRTLHEHGLSIFLPTKLRLVWPSQDLRRQLPGHIRASWQFLGSPRVPSAT